jgi:hypothetical protein
VDPGGVVAQDAERCFDLGAAVAAVDAQGHRQGPGQRVEAVIGGFGQQFQHLAQFLQEPGTWGQLVTGVDDGGSLLVQQGHALIQQGQLLLPLTFGQGAQRCFTELTQVSGQRLGRFGGIEGLEIVQCARQGRERQVGGFAERVVVDARGRSCSAIGGQPSG